MTPTCRSRIRTAPVRVGAITQSVKKMKQRDSTGCCSAIRSNVFIPSIHCGCAALRYRRFATQRDFLRGELGVRTTQDPRGSPFQMPARLADGLGHGSDLGHSYLWPFAPSPNIGSRSFGSPALALRKESQLRLQFTLLCVPISQKN